jgi:hypothetical protein
MKLLDRVRIVKGCRKLDIAANTTAQVVAITELGSEYGHSVCVKLRMLNGFKSGKVVSLYARHRNRLTDATVNLNSGNPLHKIQIVVR